MKDSWISVDYLKPSGAPIVLMHCESNNEFFVGHFTLWRGEVRVTHWQPLVGPKGSKWTLEDLIDGTWAK